MRACPRRMLRSSGAPPSFLLVRRRLPTAPSAFRRRSFLQEGYEHGGPAPAGPTLSRPVRDAEHLGYLDVGEALHMPEDQRSPVLRSYVAEGRQYLVPALRAESRLLGIVIFPGDLRRVHRLLAEFPRLLGSLFS